MSKLVSKHAYATRCHRRKKERDEAVSNCDWLRAQFDNSHAMLRKEMDEFRAQAVTARCALSGEQSLTRRWKGLAWAALFGWVSCVGLLAWLTWTDQRRIASLQDQLSLASAQYLIETPCVPAFPTPKR